MDHQEQSFEKDITKSMVGTSRFFWYLSVFAIVAMTLGGCYSLYKHRYKGTPEVEVNSSSNYKPEYK